MTQEITQLFYLAKQPPSYLVTICSAGTFKGDVQGHRVSASWDSRVYRACFHGKARGKLHIRARGQGEAKGGRFEMSFSLSQRVMKAKRFNDFKGLIMVLTSSRHPSDDISTVIILMWAFD